MFPKIYFRKHSFGCRELLYQPVYKVSLNLEIVSKLFQIERNCFKIGHKIDCNCMYCKLVCFGFSIWDPNVMITTSDKVAVKVLIMRGPNH